MLIRVISLNPSIENLPKVLVVIPCFNEAAHIEQCLTALLQQDYPKELVNIVVVDNGSTDNSVALASEFPVRVEVKKGGKVGGVRNYGASVCPSDILAFIDADCVASPQWIASAVEALTYGDDVGAVGGNCLLRENPSWVEKGWVLDNQPKEGVTNSLAGSSFLLMRSTFNSVGGFDENINAGEDTKLSKNVLVLGMQVKFLEACAVVHLGYPSSYRGFLKRQFWHASSYRKSNYGLLQDKTFLAVVIFTLLFLTMLPVSLFSSLAGTVNLLLVLLVPMLFTARRAIGAGAPVTVKGIIYAVALDVGYFVARSSGFVVGLFFDPFKKSES